jgi:outer membrane protein
MRLRERIAALLLLTVWLAGCATDSVEMAPARPDQPWTPAATATGEIIAGQKGEAATQGKRAFVLPANEELTQLPAPDTFDSSHVYTLAELIDIAESNNPLTKTAWNNARQVALAAGIARSAFLPNLTAVAVGGWQAFPRAGLSGPLDATNGGNTSTGTISSVSLNWLLFDFGQRAAVVEAAEHASAISNIGFTAAHQQLIFDVSVAFYNYAAARARAGMAAQALKNAQMVEAAAEERMRKGIGTAIDATQARQATAQARLGLVQATGAEQNGYLTLVSTLGVSPFTRLRIADVSSRKLSAGLAQPAQKVIALALARRPDVLAAYSAQKAALANVRAAEADFLPKVFMSGTGSYTNGNLYLTQVPALGTQGSIGNFSSGGLGGTVFGGLSMPLYDGGARSAILMQAQAKAENAGLALARTRNEAIRQIVLSNNTLRTSLATYDAAGAVIAASSTGFNAALDAYRNGVGAITEVNVAQSQLLQAKIISIEAHSAALSAAAGLALATGALGAAPE